MNDVVVRQQVPVRTFNDWREPPAGYCEVDLVAHGGTLVSGARTNRGGTSE
jgi:hypothetical protein